MQEIQLSKKQLLKFREHTRIKKVFIRKLVKEEIPERKKFVRKFSTMPKKKKFVRKQKLVKILSLKPGNTFLLPFSKMTGKVIYVNDCRAHVVMDQSLDLDDPKEYSYKNIPQTTDISSGTIVIKTSEGSTPIEKITKKRKHHEVSIKRIKLRRRKTL